MSTGILMLTALVPACGRDGSRTTGGEDSASAVPGGVATTPGVDPSSPEGIAQRIGSTVPPEVLVRRGACPFECCTYREWTAVTAIPLVEEQRGRGEPVRTIAAGERFQADSGNVVITSFGVVAVEDTVVGEGQKKLVPGDTVVILEPRGEGYFSVWRNGEIVNVEGFWNTEESTSRGVPLGEYRKEWWVHATTQQGQRGWFRADSTFRVSGSDRCA
jgi:hypothetical protein